MSIKRCAISIILVFCVTSMAQAEVSRERSVLLTYIITLEGVPSEAKDIRVWAPYPAENRAQKVAAVGLTSKWLRSTMEDKTYGNKILFYRLVHNGGKNVRITQQYRITRYELTNRPLGKSGDGVILSGDPEAGIYLMPNRFLEITPMVESLAREIKAKEPAAAAEAKSAYNYILTNFAYDKSVPGWGEGNVERFCRFKSGNCTDFHSFFVSLANAMGIPAKFVIGFPLGEEGSGAIKSYHCWAEFYDPYAGWVPLDVSEAWKDRRKEEYNFGAVDENRVEFTHGRDIILDPPTSNGGLNYFIYPYAEIDGKPFDNIRVKVLYKDIKGAVKDKA